MRISIKTIETAGSVSTQSTTFVEGAVGDVLKVLEGIDTLEQDRADVEQAKQFLFGQPVGPADISDYLRSSDPGNYGSYVTGDAVFDMLNRATPPRHDSSGAVKLSSGMAGAGAFDTCAQYHSPDEPALFTSLVTFFYDVLGGKKGHGTATVPATHGEAHDIAKMFMAKWRSESQPAQPAYQDDVHLARYHRIKAASLAKRRANTVAAAAGTVEDTFGGPRPSHKAVDAG